MTDIKESVAIVIYNLDRSKLLTVQRPSDDDSLPDVWSLPAATLKEGESFEQAAIRAGREKLGVDVKIAKLINEGTLDRQDYELFMKEYEVEIINHSPKVPQPIKGITQYQNLKWGTPNELITAAKKGGLCSRLFLSSIGRTW